MCLVKAVIYGVLPASYKNHTSCIDVTDDRLVIKVFD